MNAPSKGNQPSELFVQRLRTLLEKLPDPSHPERRRVYDQARSSIAATLSDASSASRQTVMQALDEGIAMVELDYVDERPSLQGFVASLLQAVIACTVIVGFLDFLKPLVNLQSFAIAASVFAGLVFVYLGRRWVDQRRAMNVCRNIAFGCTAALIGLFGVEFAFVDEPTSNGVLADSFAPIGALQDLVLGTQRQLEVVANGIGGLQVSSDQISGTTQRIEQAVGAISDGTAQQQEYRARIVAAGYPFDSQGLYEAVTDGDPTSRLFTEAGLPMPLDSVLEMLVASSSNSTDFGRMLAYIDDFAAGDVKRTLRAEIGQLLPRLRDDGLMNDARRIACGDGVSDDAGDWLTKILAGTCASEREWFTRALQNAVHLLESVSLDGSITDLQYTVEGSPVEVTIDSLNREVVALNVVYMPLRTDEGIRMYSTNHRIMFRAQIRAALLDECAPQNSFYFYCSAVAHVFVQPDGQIVIMNLTDERPEQQPSVKTALASARGGLDWTGGYGAANPENHAFIATYQPRIGAGLRVECGPAAESLPAVFITRGDDSQAIADGLFDDVMRDKVGGRVNFRIYYNGGIPYSQGTVQLVDENSVRFRFEPDLIDYLNSVDTMTFEIGSWSPMTFDLSGFSEVLAGTTGTGC